MKFRRLPKLRYSTILVTLSDEGLPTEFRIWKAGVNTDLNGHDTLFDAKAAALVMAAYKTHGVDLMIDVDHLSIDDMHPNYDGAARGWFGLEVRRDAEGGPELWAVNVKWTPEGKRQLVEGERRYFSPAWMQDDEGRATRLHNIALVATPATDHNPALAAASQRQRGPMALKILSIATLLAVAPIIKATADAELLELAAEGDGEGGGEVAPGVAVADLAAFVGVEINPAEDPAGYVAALKAKLEEIIAKLSGSAAAPSAAPPSEDMAAAKEILNLTGSTTLAQAATFVKSVRKIAAEHEEIMAERKRLAAARYEQVTRRLVVARIYEPGHAWEDATEQVPSKPAKHILVQTIESLEQMADRAEEKLRKAGAPGAPFKPAGKSGDDAGELTARELRMLEQEHPDPKVRAAKTKEYAARKAAITARKAG